MLFCIGRPNEVTDFFFEVVSRLDTTDEGAVGHSTLEKRWTALQEPLHHEFFRLFPRLHSALSYLLGLPWFSRVWIVQEVVNAQSALIFCGNRSISSDTFAQIPSLLGYNPRQHCKTIISLMPSPGRITRRGVQPLASLLHDLAVCEATDKRDKIFALLDLCADHEAKTALRPDYTKSEEGLVRDLVQFLCGCSTENIVTLPWPTVNDFLAYYSVNEARLSNEVIRLLSEVDDGINTDLLVQKHACDLKLDIELLYQAVRNSSHHLIAWIMSQESWHAVIPEESDVAAYEAFSEAMTWAYPKQHETFPCRLLELGKFPRIPRDEGWKPSYPGTECFEYKGYDGRPRKLLSVKYEHFS